MARNDELKRHCERSEAIYWLIKIIWNLELKKIASPMARNDELNRHCERNEAMHWLSNIIWNFE